MKIKKTRVEFEGEVREKEILVVDEGIDPWAGQAELRVVGRPTPRVDGFARVTGRARYTHDTYPPGTLVGRVLRSPHPHALVKSVDGSAAEALPGVHLVWHREAPPPVEGFKGRDLFPEEVAYQGAEVALVVAVDEETAEAALEALEVTYDPLPFVEDLESALAEGAPPALLGTEGNVLREKVKRYERGDVEAGRAAAQVHVDLAFTTPNANHTPLETHASVALWEGDELTLWDSTQGVFSVRQDLAEALGIARDRVRVISEFMGGGFGAKQEADRQAILAALAARAVGQPVRVILDRTEEQLVAGYRPASRQRLRMGARHDGTLTYIEHEAWEHVGAYGGAGPSTTGPSEGLYACPNVRTARYPVRANTDHSRAFRAPGYVEGTFALEGGMDELARKLGMDPLDLRLANYAVDDPKSGQPYTGKGLRAAYETGAKRSGWRERAGGERPPHPWKRGWGMASQLWGGGGGPPANAVVKLLPDATAEVLVGVQDIGTGTRTALTQIAAEELGLPLSSVRVVLGDTLPTPYGPTSSGSQTLPSAGPAVRAAARDALLQLFELAAELPEGEGTELEELYVKDGEIRSRVKPQLRIPLTQVAETMGNYTIVGEGGRGPNPDGVSINTFGAQFAGVDVNPETGQVRVRALYAVHDVGRVVNPLTATNQVYGGVVQGTGFGLTEKRVLDPQTGQQLTRGLEEYKLPTVVDAPPRVDVTFVDRADAEANSVGARGLGEPPIIPTTAAIANAVSDALGARVTEIPMTPKVILDLLRGRKEVAP